MHLKILYGLPATGKTTTIIEAMKSFRGKGGEVRLFLSNEHEELTRRKNVKPGGLMGCRTAGLNFPIDYVVGTGEAVTILESLPVGAMAVFDEAQFFQTAICQGWHNAAERGIHIIVGSPSSDQLRKLKKLGHRVDEVQVACKICDKTATTVLYEESLTWPTHLCERCANMKKADTLAGLISDIEEGNPFPGEKKTYQPFYGVPMPGWTYVRPDSEARFKIIHESAARVAALVDENKHIKSGLSYLDLGCCSGFFCDAMSTSGYSSVGVDVTKDLIDRAVRMANYKGQVIDYRCQDAVTYLRDADRKFDVTSTFATVQWVMAQKGYDVGIDCFKKLFAMTKHVCIVEMGYTDEDIYKTKITDRPREIDRSWVLDMMNEHGNFASIELHPSGEGGIWRDVFVGFREEPTARPFQNLDVEGPVTILAPPEGIWPDKWVGTTFKVEFLAVDDISEIRLSGWSPENTGETSQNIAIAIDGHEIANAQNSEGAFTIEAALKKSKGDRIALQILTSPGMPDSEEDIRPLAFVLTGFEFRSAGK